MGLCAATCGMTQALRTRGGWRVQGHGWKSAHWIDDSVFGTLSGAAATMGELYMLLISKGNEGRKTREHVTRRAVCACETRLTRESFLT